jgi:hypothetical protein
LVAAKTDLLGGALGSFFELAPPNTDHLLGREIADLLIAPGHLPFSAEILNGDAYNDVDFDAPSIPALLGANLFPRLPADEQVRIAVVVNGRVGAITRTLTRGGDERASELSAVINPDVLRPGRNEITLYVLTEHPVEGFAFQPIDIVSSRS